MFFTTASKVSAVKRLAREKNYDEAIEIADKINPDNVSSVYDLSFIAEVYMKKSRLEDAKELYLVMYERNKTHKVMTGLIEICLKLKQPEEAEQFLREFRRMEPENPERLVYRYRVDCMLGKSPEYLIKSLSKLKNEEYTDVWALELAKAYYKNNDREACAKECHGIIKYFPDSEVSQKAKVLLGACEIDDEAENEAEEASEDEWVDVLPNESLMQDVTAMLEENAKAEAVANEVVDEVTIAQAVPAHPEPYLRPIEFMSMSSEPGEDKSVFAEEEQAAEPQMINGYEIPERLVGLIDNVFYDDDDDDDIEDESVEESDEEIDEDGFDEESDEDEEGLDDDTDEESDEAEDDLDEDSDDTDEESDEDAEDDLDEESEDIDEESDETEDDFDEDTDEESEDEDSDEEDSDDEDSDEESDDDDTDEDSDDEESDEEADEAEDDLDEDSDEESDDDDTDEDSDEDDSDDESDDDDTDEESDDEDSDDESDDDDSDEDEFEDEFEEEDELEELEEDDSEDDTEDDTDDTDEKDSDDFDETVDYIMAGLKKETANSDGDEDISVFSTIHSDKDSEVNQELDDVAERLAASICNAAEEERAERALSEEYFEEDENPEDTKVMEGLSSRDLQAVLQEDDDKAIERALYDLLGNK